MIPATLWALKNWRLLLIGGAIFVLGMVGIRLAGLSRKLAQAQEQVRDLEGYKQTRRVGDEVDTAIGDDPDAARRVLRERRPPKR